MSDESHGYATIEAWLQATRAEELDCDRFAELLAPWLDRRIDDPKLLDLLAHHRRLCRECDEEATLLEVALQADD